MKWISQPAWYATRKILFKQEYFFSELPDSKLSKLLWFLSPETVDNGKHEEFLSVLEQRGLKADI
jgi:hypothetical protein